MGAPGFAYLCKKGHLFGWIEHDLIWSGLTYKKKADIEKRGCPCGEMEWVKLFHYGSINDCICLPSEVASKGLNLNDSSPFYYLEEVKELLDKEGQPLQVKGYQKKYLLTYYITEEIWRTHAKV